VMARTGGGQGSPSKRGITAFLVERGAPGFSVASIHRTMGSGQST